MQKTIYNNHYYLLLLLCAIMVLLPANAALSADARINPAIKCATMPAWCRYVIVLQIGIVYFYAAVAKLYPYWLNGSFTGGILNRAARHYHLHFLHQKWLHIFVAYAGIAFDLLLVPALLYRKTRPYAVAAAVFFHLFNSATLHIGIFPYLSLALLVFFFPPEAVQKFFFRKKKPVIEVKPYPVNKPLLIAFAVYFIFQALMPLRHHIIKGDVNWTEEGHRLSWRMMLRKRKGYAQFRVVDKATGKQWFYDLDAALTPTQKKHMQTKPDMVWQMAQYIHNEYTAAGKDVAVYVTCKVTLNKNKPRLLINPNIDMAAARWNYFSHNEWLLLHD